MNARLRIAALAALLAPTALSAQRQDPRYPAFVLRLPASTRMLALGNVGVAGRDDDVLFYNPAQLVAARGTSVSAETYASGARTAALSSVVRFNTGGIAVGGTFTSLADASSGLRLGRPDLFVRGPRQARSSAFMVGIGQVVKRTRVGVTAKYFEDNTPGWEDDGPALDVGVARDFFNYTFALSAVNIGYVGRRERPGSTVALPGQELPTRISLGVARSMPVGPIDLFATAASAWRADDGFFVPGAGVEVGYSWLEGFSIAGRVGLRRPEQGEGAFTGGAGFTMDRLSIDYAIESLSGGRVGHRLGLRIR